MKTNFSVNCGKFEFPNKTNVIDVLKPKTDSDLLDNGFVFYSKLNEDDLVCFIHFDNRRRLMELRYETTDRFRGEGYMQEALRALIDWIFSNTTYSELYALINCNDASEHILKKLNFQLDSFSSNNIKWYVLRRNDNVIQV